MPLQAEAAEPPGKLRRGLQSTARSARPSAFARTAARGRLDRYHSVLQVYVPEGRFVIEQALVWGDRSERGVVAEGAVGASAARRPRLFLYEIRRWRDGIIPNVDEAVESASRLSDDPDRAPRLLELVPQVPTPVWGRDERCARASVELELDDLVAPRPGAGSTSSRSRSPSAVEPGLEGQDRDRAAPASTTR